MAQGKFITGTGEIERKYMVTYVNTGTEAEPDWEAVGVKVEDSAIELNPDIDTVTDILGITNTTINKLEPQQSFSPFSARKESKLAQKLYTDYIYDKNLAALSEYEVMVVYGFSGTTGSYDAERQTGCTIELTSIGGSGRVDMPFNIHFSNKSTWGTVSELYPNKVTFTPNN